MKSDKSVLWIFGGIAAVLGLLSIITGLPTGLLSGTPARPVPGKVFELSEDNLAVARRHAPVLFALYTADGNVAGARMARGLTQLADSVKDRAIVALGNVANEPELGRRAQVGPLPAWVVYCEGREVARATGDNADLSLNRFLSEYAGAPR